MSTALKYYLVSVPDGLEPTVEEFGLLTELVEELRAAVENPGYYYVFSGDRVLIKGRGRNRFLMTTEPIPLTNPFNEDLEEQSYINLDVEVSEIADPTATYYKDVDEDYDDNQSIPPSNIEVDTDQILEEWSDEQH